MEHPVGHTSCLFKEFEGRHSVLDLGIRYKKTVLNKVRLSNGSHIQYNSNVCPAISKEHIQPERV
jgi:hypothetical protein